MPKLKNKKTKVLISGLSWENQSRLHYEQMKSASAYKKRVIQKMSDPSAHPGWHFILSIFTLISWNPCYLDSILRWSPSSTSSRFLEPSFHPRASHLPFFFLKYSTPHSFHLANSHSSFHSNQLSARLPSSLQPAYTHTMHHRALGVVFLKCKSDHGTGNYNGTQTP